MLLSNSHLVDELHNDQLQDVAKGGHLVDAAAQVVQGPLLKVQKLLLLSHISLYEVLSFLQCFCVHSHIR